MHCVKILTFDRLSHVWGLRFDESPSMHSISSIMQLKIRTLIKSTAYLRHKAFESTDSALSSKTSAFPCISLDRIIFSHRKFVMNSMSGITEKHFAGRVPVVRPSMHNVQVYWLDFVVIAVTCADRFHGGWAAPNIYSMGFASVLNFGGLRIAGLSGIYKSKDYQKGTFAARVSHCKGSLRL